MSIFKAFFSIIKKNKMTFILAIAINLGITFAYAQVNKNEQPTTFTADKSPIAVINHDDGILSKALVTYLGENARLVELEPSQKAEQDALFFKKVLYIATIPQHFSKELIDGHAPVIMTQSVPSSEAELQITRLINLFVSKVSFYQELFPDKNQSEILTLVQDNLAQKSTVLFETSTEQNDKKNITARIFNLLAYGFFMSIMSSIGLVSISLNKLPIKRRSNCSPLSERKQSRYFALAVTLFSLVSWVLFNTLNLILSKSILTDSMTLLLLLNSAVFLLTIISLSVMLSQFIKNHEMLSALNNILILGTCFISGAFVPQELMNDTVLKISSFFPTYWFVTNNNLLASLSNYNKYTLQEFGFNLSILLLFALIFALISFISRKEKGGKSLNPI